jgi:histidinol phosphatase-like enzyme
VQVCPHGPDDGCACRKPAPGMVKAACAQLDVDPARCVVVGDIGADVDAAAAAGAVGILVPTPVTRKAEVARAREGLAAHVADTLTAAVADVLAGRW